VDRVEPSQVTEHEARGAGFDGAADLHEWLGQFRDGDVYRIEVRFDGEDPRPALRESADFDESELSGLRQRLEQMDARSKHGPWTLSVLQLIDQHPGTRAADLAAQLGRETQPFKTDVRKLKELGLTESLEVGYRLSP